MNIHIKKIFIILLVTISLLVSGTICIYGDETTYTEGPLYYTISNDSVTITGCFGRDDTIVIPSSIAGYPVNTIKAGAFNDSTYVKEVVLPDTITSIEENAFADGIIVSQEIDNEVTTVTPEVVSTPTETEDISTNDVDNTDSDTGFDEVTVILDDAYKSTKKEIDDSSIIEIVSETETLITNSDGTSFREITVKDNNEIEIIGDSNIIPTGTVFNETELTKDSKEYSKVEEAINNDSTFRLNEAVSLKAYDLNLVLNSGVELHELDGYIEVNMPLSDDLIPGDNQYITVYRINDDNSLTVCESEIIDGKLSFKTDHFSIYLFVLNSNEAVQDVTTVEIDANNHITVYSIIAIILLVTIIVLSVVIIKKKKKK